MHGNGGNRGTAINDGTANGQSGTNSGNGGNGGLAIGAGSQANGANGQKGGLAIGAGSNANVGGVALNGGDRLQHSIRLTVFQHALHLPDLPDLKHSSVRDLIH